MQGAEERQLRRINNTPQGEATEGNAADDTLMVDQGRLFILIDNNPRLIYKNHVKKYILASLCSALVVPGLGQIINQSLKKGLYILSVVFILFVAGTIKLFLILRSVLTQANAGRLNTGPIAEQLQRKDLVVLWVLSGLFAVMWIYSILDAFWTGKRMENQ
jgi:hypothetical protein